MNQDTVAAELARISEGRHHDPFSVLGRHVEGGHAVLRACIPFASEVRIAELGMQMTRLPGTDIFEWRGDGCGLPSHYSLIWRDDGHREQIARDPYTFLPQISDFDLDLFGEGRHRHAHRFLGAREHEVPRRRAEGRQSCPPPSPAVLRPRSRRRGQPRSRSGSFRLRAEP